MLKVDVIVDFYGEKKRLSVSFEKGMTLVLGETGAYKSTLMKVIGGVRIIEDGEISLDGERIEQLSPRERSMMLISEETLPTYKKVGKALMQPLILRGASRKNAKLVAIEAAQRYGLDFNGCVLDKKRRFFEARMSLRETKVTMFDEPYHFFNEDVSDMIKGRRSDYVIVTSSDGEDVRLLRPDTLIVLREGEVLQSGKSDEVSRFPVNKYVNLLVNM